MTLPLSTRSPRSRRPLAAFVLSLLVLSVLPLSAQFVITEFMAVNDTTLNDETGANSDWIEVHNDGTLTASLDGWFLTDETNNLAKWRFPSTNIPPNTYLVVFASGENRIMPGEPLHTNFRLTGDGEYLALVRPDASTVASEFAPAFPRQIADVSYGTVRNTAPVPLLNAGAPATATVPADPSDGLAWTTVEFDDTAWQTGTTAVGYDRLTLGVNYLDYIGLNIETAMYNVNQSAYVRVPFTVTNPGDLTGLHLSMRFEDGFVAYLNGVEVAGSNAPPAPAWNSAATAPRTDTSATNAVLFDISESRDLLAVGNNLLAIHALNIPVNSPDLLVWPELTGLSSAGEPVGRYFPHPTPGAPNDEGVETLGPIIDPPQHSPTRPNDGDNIVVTAALESAFAPVGSVFLKYRVMFGAEISVEMFDDGAHGDGSPGDGTYGASIPFTVSSAGQMVRWYLTATDATGTNTSRLPPFTRSDSPEYFGTVIRDPGLNNPLPVFHWFVQNVAATDTTGGTRCSVFYGDEFYDNLFCRVRGASAPSFPKKPYKFDFNPGHHFRFLPGQPRVDEINLNSTYQDKAYLRAPLTFETYRRSGVAAADAFNVRVQQNDAFYSVAAMIEQVDETFLERRDLDPAGALYKLFNGVTSASSGVEKKTRRYENNTDLQQLVNAVAPGNPNRASEIFDRVDLPATINYLASGTISQDWDRSAKNLYLYRDTEGDGLWTMLPWDKDLTFGKAALLSDVVVGDKDNGPDLGSEEEKISHPFYGTPEYSCCGANYLMDAIYKTPATREMYLRRLRTLMDQLLQPPGTPLLERRFESRLDELAGLLGGDAALDLNRWGAGYGQLQTLSTAIQAIKTAYLEPRRIHLYETHSLANIGNYAPAVGTPSAQIGSPVLQFGAVDISPASGNQLEEYVELLNPNTTAVDISGWRLEGAVSFTFEPGTVVPGGGRVYVSPDVQSFRGRATAPRGGQGLLIVGNYRGQLSARGETLRLLDAQSVELATQTTPATPSDPQRFLRITELHYNPAPVPELTNAPSDFEFLELKNTSTNVSLSLANVRFAEGVLFNFNDSTLSQLAPGERLVLVADLDAHSRLRGPTPVAGPFTGTLNNGGERIRLLDASNEEILDFEYDNAWYPVTDGLGFSLVVVDEAADPDRWNQKEQWRPSSTPGGSPAEPDAPYPDFPPVIINEVLSRTDLPPPTDSIELHNPSAFPADVSDWFISDDPGTPRKFRIPGGTVIPPGGYLVFDEADFNAAGQGFAFSSLGDEAFLFSADAQTNLTGYRDGFEFGAADDGVSFGLHRLSTGETQPVAQRTTTLGSTNSEPLVGPVVISEIMYHPPAAGTAVDEPLARLLGDANPAASVFDPEPSLEYIELRNTSGDPVSLFDTSIPGNTWRLRGAADFNFPSNFMLSPHGLILLVGFDPVLDADARARFEAAYELAPGTPLLGPWQGVLPNDGGRIELQKPGSPVAGVVPRIVVEVVQYRDNLPWPAAADGDGSSLQRRDSAAFGNDPINWFAAGRSAGQANVFNDPPTVQLTSPSPNTIFNESDPILLLAEAADADGSVTRVRFYSGTLLVGEAVDPPFEWLWTNAVFGTHTLTATVTDDRFATTVSDPVLITVEARPPSVAIVSPVPGAQLLNSLPLAIVLNAIDLDGFIVLAEFFSDGVKLGETASVPFAFTWTDPAPGTHQLQAAVTDNSGNRVFSETVAISVSAGFSADRVLIATGAVWNYFDLGSDLGTLWREPGYDDAAWDSGPAPLGYGDGDEATETGYGPDPNNKFTTTYFRHTFSLTNTSSVSALNLEILRDDGAVVYLNGAEAFRTGMPDGPVTFSTFANIVVIDGDESTNFFAAVLDPTWLVEGLNTLAVEIHQRSLDSSDISFDLKLQAVSTFLAPVIAAQPQSLAVDAGNTAVFSVSANGTQPLHYQWRFNDADLPGETSPTLVLDSVELGQGGAYSVVVTNTAGSTASDVVYLAVTVPGDYSATILADTPIHYYRLAELEPAHPALDMGQPGGFDGTYQGGVSLNRSTAPLTLGTGALFDGNPGTFVDLGLFHPGGSFTVEAWISLAPSARANSFHAIVARWDGSFELDVATDDRPNLVVRNQANAFGLVAAPEAIVRGRWYHLAGVYADGLLTIYVDGEPVATAPLAGTLRNGGPSPDRVLIGATRSGSSSSFNWKGLIDEVAVYDYAVPHHRLRAHYLAGLPRVSLTLTPDGELSWPSFPAGLQLQHSEQLGPNAAWETVSPQPTPQNGLLRTTLPFNESQGFYRLLRTDQPAPVTTGATQPPT